jgi:hypothetical protein
MIAGDSSCDFTINYARWRLLFSPEVQWHSKDRRPRMPLRRLRRPIDQLAMSAAPIRRGFLPVMRACQTPFNSSAT